MAIVSLTNLKNWFRTGLKPTQSQFWDTLESYFHKEDTIPQASVDGLEDALAGIPTQESIDDLTAIVSGTTVNKNNGETIALSAGDVLEFLVVTSALSQTVKIETGSGLENIVPLTEFGAGGSQVFRCDFLSVGSSTLTVTCTSQITIKYFKR